LNLRIELKKCQSKIFEFHKKSIVNKNINFQKYIEFAKIYLDDVIDIKMKLDEEILQNE
jgi:hypothetical protein